LAIYLECNELYKNEMRFPVHEAATTAAAAVLFMKETRAVTGARALLQLNRRINYRKKR